MKTIRTLAAGLLILTGILHLLTLFFMKFDATSYITIFFGVAYLVIGYFLFRESRRALWLGAIVPLVGLLLAVIGMLTNPTWPVAFFILIDIIVVVCCFYLLFKKV